MQKSGFFQRKVIRNFFLLLSLAAALSLFLTSNIISTAVCAVLFLAVCVLLAVNSHLPESVKESISRTFALCLAIFICWMGIQSFTGTWLSSPVSAALAGKLHLSADHFLLAAGLFLAAVGFYTAYTCSLWFVGSILHFMESRLYARTGSNRWVNTGKAWWFLLSALSFFCLYLLPTDDSRFAVICAMILLLFLVSGGALQAAKIRKAPIFLKVFCLLTAFGICWSACVFFWQAQNTSLSLTNSLAEQPIFQFTWPMVLGIIGAVLAVPFVYVCLMVFWKKLLSIFSDLKTFSGLTNTEKRFMACLGQESLF